MELPKSDFIYICILNKNDSSYAELNINIFEVDQEQQTRTLASTSLFNTQGKHY